MKIPFLKNLFVLLALIFIAYQNAQAQLKINEILAVNTTIAADPDFGEFSDFVELHNIAGIPVNIGGFTITDNPEETDKWVLPSMVLAPDQYLVIWTDGLDKRPGETAFVPFKNEMVTMTALHTNFSLSGDGEYVGIFNAQGNLIDENYFGVQTSDVSYGVSATNASQWLYFGEVSLGAINSLYGSALMESPGEPIFSLTEGFYSDPQTLFLSTSEPNAVIRFTFDGSTPNASSPVYSAGIPINLSLTIKARIFVEGKMPGNVVTKSYFINENNEFPVLSISSSASNLYGFDFGILQNAIKDREVPATIEYFEPQTGERAFQAGVGIRVFGTSIYSLPQRPLSVRFREKYGTEILRYPLFPEKPIPRYSSFLLRNGGNDYNTTFFRDGLGVNLVKGKIDIDYQDYKPCVVFINGAYNGIYEFRERLDEQYIGNNHEINPENLDYLEDSLQVVTGSQHSFKELMEFVQNNNLADAENYAYIESQVDINEFLNYLILRSFIGYQIADLNNHYWKNRDADGNPKWRWVAADLEHGFGQLSGDPVNENTIAKLAGISGDLPEWATMLFNRLLQNNSFRDEFIQRSAAYLNTIFNPITTIPILDSLQAHFQTQMPRHIGRWNTPPSISVWQSNIDQIESFLQNRPAFYRQHLTELFGTEDGAQVSMEIVGQGKVILSGTAFTDSMSGTFFKNASITLHAIPAPGHRFVMWQGIDGNNSSTQFTPIGDTSFVAIFAPENNLSIIPPIISQDTTLAASASPWYGFEDIVVMPGARLTVEAGATINLTDGVCIDVRGGISLRGNANQRVTIQSDPSPSARRDFYGQTGMWGSIFAESPTDSIILQFSDLKGGSFGRNRSLHFSTISGYNCPILIENSTITEGKAPLIARGGSAIITHSEFHTFSSVNGFISLYNMDAPRIENCIFRGNRAINTDAIDIKGITNGVVSDNEIYGFLGSNCDGIDLGIYSDNVLIERNFIHDCTDKGISIGSQSNAIVKRNLIYDCDLGVALKDSLSVAHLDQNTLYGNRIGVACYEKSTLRGGAEAFVKNTIISESFESSISFDSKSEIQVEYSLSDREAIPGTGNLNQSPMLIHPTTGNFQLSANSPCIDSGDPLSAPDPDESTADMGAYYTHSGNYGLLMHINEFSYNDPFNYPTGDWIELFNRTDQPINMAGWKITHGISEFTISDSIIVAPSGYLVVCQDVERFQNTLTNVSNVVGDFHFDLNNKSGKIALFDAAGQQIHSVRYADYRPWPPLADGHGATVELDQNQEGNSPLEWRESYSLLGTPGLSNSLPPDITGIFVNEVMASNTNTIADENGEFDDWFELFNASNDSINVGGLSFSDNDTDQTKWQIPLNFPTQTTIPPNGFLVIWADEDQDQGPLHADFKLSATGEMIALSQRDGLGYIEKERLEFGQQILDITFGRIPDGGALLQFMQPTPGASNSVNGMQELKDGEINIFPNPFSDVFSIQVNQIAKPYHLQITDLVGKVILEKSNLAEDQIQLDRGNLANGIYLVKITDANGEIYSSKAMAN